MALVFPPSPSVSDEWVDANGTKWLCTYASPDPVRWEKVLDVNAAAIVDSTLDNSVIGGVSPANGTFIDLEALGNLLVAGNSTVFNLEVSGLLNAVLDSGTFDTPLPGILKVDRSETALQLPAFTGAEDYGKLAVNIADKKIYIANSTGAPIELSSPSKIMSDTPPSSPIDGQEWFDTTSGYSYTWFVDIDSSQWLADVAEDNGGGIADVPDDGLSYVRQHDAWVPSVILRGVGTPEGVVTGSIGNFYINTDGGTDVTFWVKESGAATNTGWSAK